MCKLYKLLSSFLLIFLPTYVYARYACGNMKEEEYMQVNNIRKWYMNTIKDSPPPLRLRKHTHAGRQTSNLEHILL